MSNTILGNAFKNVADAIRAKGVTGTMSPLEMPAKVASIPTGRSKFGISIGSLFGDVDQQGNYLNPSEPFSVQSTEILGLADNVLYSKFFMNNGITSLSLPNVTSLGITSLYAVCSYSTSLRSVDFSGLLECGNSNQGTTANNMAYAF